MLLERSDEDNILLIKGDYYFVEGIKGAPKLIEICGNGCIFESEDFSNFPQSAKTTRVVAKFEDIEGACPF